MNRTIAIVLLYSCTFLSCLAVRGEARPNIIIMMSDDMGYSDLGCFGSEIQTPHLDKLAAEGIRYTQMYNTSKCTTTRSSLLTGRYVIPATWTSNLETGPLIGEVLQLAGYRTLWSGKNHSHILPPRRGFDRFYGFQGGACNFWNPGDAMQDGSAFPYIKAYQWMVDDQWLPQYIPKDPNYYMTDVITDNALGWLDEYQGEEKPFFLYLAYNSPHWPLHAKPDDIAQYKGYYDKGYQNIRNTRYQRMIEMGVFEAINAPLFPEDIRDWATLSEQEKALESQNMEIHAAMVHNLDQNIGRVIEKLKQHGDLDNTVIFFFTDNGASAERDQRAKKNYQPTGDEPIGSVKTYECIGKDWGRAINAPFAKHKATSYEGGIRTPMIGYWPNGQQTELQKPGGFYRESAHLVDMMSTAIDLAETSYPETFRNRKSEPIEGTSLVPSFKGQSLDREKSHFFYWGGHHAYIDGDWKIIRSFKKKQPWELYNLSANQTETVNLADQHPGKVIALEQAWEKREAYYRQVSKKIDMNSIRNNFYDNAGQ